MRGWRARGTEAHKVQCEALGFGGSVGVCVYTNFGALEIPLQLSELGNPSQRNSQSGDGGERSHAGRLADDAKVDRQHVVTNCSVGRCGGFTITVKPDLILRRSNRLIVTCDFETPEKPTILFP